MVDSIDKQADRLTAALRDYSTRQVYAAHSSALNKSVPKIKTRTVRGVSRETKVPQKYIRKRFVQSRAKPSRPRSKLSAWQQGVNVADVARNPARGKKVRFSGKTKPAINNASFYNNAKSGKLLALQREGKGRYPIDVIKVDIKGPIDRIFPKVSSRVMLQEFPKILVRDLIYRINKYAKF